MRHKVIHLVHKLLRSQMKVVCVDGQTTGDSDGSYKRFHVVSLIQISVNRHGPYLANFCAAALTPAGHVLLAALRDFSDPSAWSTERVEMHALLSVTPSTAAFRARFAAVLGLFGWRRIASP